MAIYSAYVSPDAQMPGAARDFRLVSDRKAIMALIVPPLWLIWHRLWLELLIYLGIWAGIGMLASWQPGIAIAYLSALPGFYLLLEGNELIRRKLERDGWIFAGIFDADNSDEAELRFVLQNANMLQTVVPRPHQSFHPAPKSLSPVGLFPE